MTDIYKEFEQRFFDFNSGVWQKAISFNVFLESFISEFEISPLKPLTYSPSAKKVYAAEVETLNAKLNNALRNAPLERQAQVIANTIVKIKRDAIPDMDATELKKVKAPFGAFFLLEEFAYSVDFGF